VYRNLRETNGGTRRAGDNIFFYGKGNINHQFGSGFLHSTE